MCFFSKHHRKKTSGPEFEFISHTLFLFVVPFLERVSLNEDNVYRQDMETTSPAPQSLSTLYAMLATVQTLTKFKTAPGWL